MSTKKLQKLNDPQRLVDIPAGYICDKLGIKNPKVLVEIGAGTAFFSIAFLQELAPSSIYACDISEVMITWVKENVIPDFSNIIPVKCSENSVPLDDRIADLVFMINLHHELDSPAKTLGEAYRLLKPEGEIFIVDWKKKEMPEGPPREIRYLPEQVKKEMTDAGFDAVSIFSDLPKHFLVVGKKILKGT